MWFKKTVIHSDEYELLHKKHIEVCSKLEILDGKFKILETNMDNLRGNINARLLRKFKKEEEEEKAEDSKNINNGVILPYNGTFQ